MNKNVLILGFAGILLFSGCGFGLQACTRPDGSPCESSSQENLTSKTMKLTSTAFQTNQLLPAKYSCDGENISPPLEISGVPEKALSLALIYDDPDAPAGLWTHWTLWNIQPNTTKIDENSKPDSAVEGLNTSGELGYGSPCPPSGTHRYIFHLYALDTMLDLAPGSKIDALKKAIEGRIIDSTELIGLYKRQ